MDSRSWRALLIGILLIGAIAAVGYYGYQTGMARGLAEGASLTAPEQGAVPIFPYAPFAGHFYPHFFGLGPLGCLIPFLFFFLFLGLLRGLFWGRHWGWGRGHGMGGGKYGPEGSEVPPMVREWHRRMHDSEAGGTGTAPTPSA